MLDEDMAAHTPRRIFAPSLVIIVGALTFFPALSLGPILEHLQLQQGILH